MELKKISRQVVFIISQEVCMPKGQGQDQSGLKKDKNKGQGGSTKNR